MKVQYLTVEEIVAIHRMILEGMGGRKGLREHGLLFAACEKPKTIIAGREVYEGLLRKATVLLEALINYHPFIDGNKRTAFLVAKNFLKLNGCYLSVKKNDGMNFIIAIANKKISLRDTENWIASHLDPQD